METRDVNFDGVQFRIADKMAQWANFRNGQASFGSPWERKVSETIREFIKPKMVFVDAGANFGAYSFLAANRDAIVHAFEPEPKNFELLEYNLSNLPNATAYNLVLSDECKSIHFDIDQRGRGGHHIVSSESKHSIIIDAVTIDSLLINPHAIKIDVEGHGESVLSGAKDSLSSCQLVIMEIHNQLEADCKMLLNALGFDILFNHKGFIATKSKVE